MASRRSDPGALGRSVRIYRKLLIAYPPGFRSQYGEDLEQSFRDLVVFSTDGRGIWWRTTKDLLTSATRERGANLFRGPRPSIPVLLAVLAGVLAVVLAGPGLFLPVILLPSVILIGLPLYGISLFHRAWVIRKTTGAGITRTLIAGVASFVPAGVALALMGEEAGYFVFVAVGLTLIVGSALGIIWAVVKLLANKPEAETKRRWLRPLLILVPSLAILGFIIGASYNSYRNSLGPPGDHSVANASADTRALWEAANAGSVDTVIELTTTTCADPWVKFPVGNGRHNAKGWAETRTLQVADHLEPPFNRIADILGDYMDDWYERCGQDGD